MEKVKSNNVQGNASLARCLKGNPSTLACFSQYCQQISFICQNSDCSCSSCHKFCLQAPIHQIKQFIQAKNPLLKPLKEQIIKVFDQAIAKLSSEREFTLAKLSNQFMYIGLNYSQRKFMNAVKKGTDCNLVTCEMVSAFYEGENVREDEAKIQQKIQSFKQKINQIGKHFFQEISSFSSNLVSFLENVRQSEYKFFDKSKMITVEDSFKIRAFFGDKKIIEADLLYRASQNQFEVSKFHEKCDHIPNTLTLVETDRGKLIGGFTTLCWFKEEKSIFVSPEKNIEDNFLFSLTENDKLILRNPNMCIFRSSDDQYGPYFGGPDLRIANKANENQKSSSWINHAYHNPKYNYKNGYDPEPRTKFSGACDFRIKEWEVWKLLLI